MLKLYSTCAVLKTLFKKCSEHTTYTSYTGEQEANMPRYKLTLHFKYSEMILQFASSNLTMGLWMRKGNVAETKCKN